MRLSSITTEGDFSRLRELAPTLGSGAASGATPGGAPAAAFSAPASQAAPGVAQAAMDPQADAKMQAQQALDRVNRKKEIQAQIAAAQKQVQELQKQLAQIK